MNTSALARIDAAIDEAIIHGLPAGHLQEARGALANLIDAAEYMLAAAYSGPDQDVLRLALADVQGGAA